MKITPKVQTNEMDKTNNKNKNTLVKGSNVQAKVISVDGKAIMVEVLKNSGTKDLSGQSLSGLLDKPEGSLLGKEVNLQVIGQKNGEMLLSLASSSVDEGQSLPTQIQSNLSAEDQKALIKLFDAKGIPMTQDNIKLVNEGKIAMEKIQNISTEGAGKILLGKLSADMKSIALDLFKSQGQASNNLNSGKALLMGEDSAQQKTLVNDSTKDENLVFTKLQGDDLTGKEHAESLSTNKVSSEKTDQLNIKVGNGASGKNITQEKTGEQLPIITKQVMGKEASEETTKNEFESKVAKAMTEDFKQVLASSDKLAALTMLLKNKMAFTLKNAVFSEKLLVGEKHVLDQLSEIKELLPKELSGLIKAMSLDQVTQESEVKDFYKSIVDKLEQNIEMSGLKEDSNLEAKMAVLKTSISFMDESEGEYTFVQVPIDLKNKESNLNIAFKKDEKSKKGIDKFNTVIFIALDTVNLGTVQSKIKVNKGLLEVNIMVEDEQIRKTFVNQLEALQEGLDDTIYDKPMIKVSVKKKNENFFQLITGKDEKTEYGFNMKV